MDSVGRLHEPLTNSRETVLLLTFDRLKGGNTLQPDNGVNAGRCGVDDIRAYVQMHEAA